MNPEFVKEIKVDYYFEMQQVFRVEVYDVDDLTQVQNLALQDKVGSFEFKLGKLVSARDQEMVGDIDRGANAKSSKKAGGTVKVMAKEMREEYGKTQVSFVVNADIKNANGACFLTLNRKLKNG